MTIVTNIVILINYLQTRKQNMREPDLNQTQKEQIKKLKKESVEASRKLTDHINSLTTEDIIFLEKHFLLIQKPEELIFSQ